MTDPLVCLGCGTSAPDGICESCGRVLSWRPLIGLVAGAVLLLAALFGFWCVT